MGFIRVFDGGNFINFVLLIFCMEIMGFVVAIFLGALIGLQREFSQQEKHFERFAGFRTFILITFFGAILGFLGGGFDSLLVIVGFIGIILLTIISYILDYLKSKSMSVTTEVAAIMAYVIGVMCTLGYMQFAIIFAILITAFLAFKERFHNIVKKIEKKEIFAIIKFAIISLVILPILPNRNYSPMDVPGLGNILENFGIAQEVLLQLDIFNFYHIWLMVILVAGISFLGYFLVKIFDSGKSYGILGFIGGLVSSTAVTLSMAGESKKHKGVISPFVLATVVAMSIMFFRIIFEVAVVNSALLSTLFFPLIAMFFVGILIAFVFFKKKKSFGRNVKKIEFRQPFAIVPALKFGGFFLLVLFISRVAQLMFGHVGIYATSILSGLADVDAITLSMASLSKSGEVDNFVATTSIILAAASNTLVKAGIAFFLGSRKFGKLILGIFSIVLLVGLGVLFFM